MVPLDLHLCLINHTHVPRARSGTYIGVRAVGGRVVCEAGAVRGRWSGRDTSCGTVVLQRGLDQTSGPRRQRSTRVGLFLLLVRAGTNSCCKCGTVRLQTHFLSMFDLISKASPRRRAPFFASCGRASVGELPDQFRDTELHAIRQELPSHSRLPVRRPRDWVLACRQYRLLCAWPASFGERLVHSMQSFTPGPLPPPPLVCLYGSALPTVCVLAQQC